MKGYIILKTGQVTAEASFNETLMFSSLESHNVYIRSYVKDSY